MKHIRIISPSGTIDPYLIDGCKERLVRWGYYVSEGKHARGKYGRFAGTEAERLGDISDALSDPSVDIILCSRGGYGLQQIISRLPDPCQMFGVKPIFVGFSDITELHQWCRMHEMSSLHGIMCKHLVELPEDSEPVMFWRRALAGEPLVYGLPVHPLDRAGEVSGILTGGNLSVLYGLQGTPFAIRTDDHPILFIEDICENHYHIDRMMQNFRLSGVLARLGGLVVGQFAGCDDDLGMNCSLYETIRSAVEEYDYPLIFDFPAGHVDKNLPLWMNRQVTISVTCTGARLCQ